MTKRVVITVSAALILSLQLCSGQNLRADEELRRALEMYDAGMYERARSIFESLEGEIPAAYSVLCATKSHTADCRILQQAFSGKYPGSLYESMINLYTGANLFDDGNYSEASDIFGKINPRDLPSGERAQYFFKSGFSAAMTGDYAFAESCYEKVVRMAVSPYTASARYNLGYVYYLDGKFAKAVECFRISSGYASFRELSEFYLLECKFMLGDFAYVADNGPGVFSSSAEPRRSRVARLLSEAYLSDGNAEMARFYYNQSNPDGNRTNRSDTFYEGTLLYACGEYAAAKEKYLEMGERTDSLGQIAEYHLGYCNIRTKNKFDALESFRKAASLSYDDVIREDAYFNYAKLSFDLNADQGAFESYSELYPASEKNDQMRGYIALSLLSGRDYAGALKMYSSITEMNEEQNLNYAKANYLRAAQLMNSGAYGAAAECLKAVSACIPRKDVFNQLSRFYLAEAYYRSGKYKEAESVLTPLNQSASLAGLPEGELLPYNLAYAMYKQGKYDLAARYFDEYSKSYSLCRKDAMTRRADCDFQRRYYSAAAKSYSDVVTEYPDASDLYPYYQMGISYGLSGRIQDKVKSLEIVNRSPSGTPMRDAVVYELGRAYLDAGRPNDALSAFAGLSMSKDESYAARAIIGMGMANRNLGRNEDAIDNYKKVVKLYPSSPYADDALLAVNSIYQEMGQGDKYLEYIEKNGINDKKTEADRENIYFNTAEQLYLAGNYQRAITSLEKFMAKYPQSASVPKAEFYMAESLRNTSDKQKAVEYYALVVDKMPGTSFAELSYGNIADLTYSMDEFDKAFEAYNSLLANAKMQNNITKARLGMMRSAYRLGNNYAAIEACDHLLSADLKDSDLKREVMYVKAKASRKNSDYATSNIFMKKLAEMPDTPEGAEASYILIQDALDKGDFKNVETLAFKFSQNAGDQSYWLAKAFIALGDSFVEQSNLPQAKATFESVRDGYTPFGSDDDVPALVNSRLESLKPLM